MEGQVPEGATARGALARRLGALRGRRFALPLALLLVLVVAGGAMAALGGGGGPKAPSDPKLTGASVDRKAEPERPIEHRPQVVQIEGVGSDAPRGDPRADAPSPGAPTDAEVREELRQARAQLAAFKRHLNSTAFLQTGPQARVLPDGTAQAPEDAPDVVKRVILAANEIAKFPYKWGGGHGAWRDNGYDCSGSVSFALAGAGLLDRPLASGGFFDYGDPGPGEWITIYTNPGHMFMVVAGLRFDTSGRGRAGTRWQEAPRSVRGFVVRHPPGF
jgi:cell wall-associated NlpC family hydrolase